MKSEKTIKGYANEFKKLAKQIKELQDKKDNISKWLLTKGNVVENFDNVLEVKKAFEELNLCYVAATVSMSPDTKQLKQDFPLIYKEILVEKAKKHYIK